MNRQINQARWLAVLAATAIALFLCWLMLRPFISVLAWAVVLVIVFYPVHDRLASRIGRRSLSALLSCFLVVLIAVIPLTVITLALAEELSKVLPNLPAQFTTLLNPQASVVGRGAEWIKRRFGVDKTMSEQINLEKKKKARPFILSQ